MKLAVFAFTRRGCELAQKVPSCLPDLEETRLYTMEKFAIPGFLSLASPLWEFAGPVFSWADALIFVGACGVAVRAISPWVRDKKTDPAVLVMDEKGQFVISLLSGHIGNANRLARVLADHLCATPVITTATDVNGRFSVDQWASEQGLFIDDMASAKAVSAAILERDIPLCADFPIATPLPAGVIPGDTGPLGIYIGYRDASPFTQTLRLIPKVLRLGIGCRRDAPKERIEAAVLAVLEEHRIRREAVKAVASIGLKSNEPGLKSFCEAWKLPISFYSAQTLQAIPGAFTPSPFVQAVTGVDNVCERSAMMGANRIIVPKTARDGVTVALAVESWEVAF